MNVSPASFHDIKTIIQLAHSIWPTHYNSIIGKKQVDYMLATIYNEAAITHKIKNNNEIFFIITNNSNNPVGFSSHTILQQTAKLNKLYVMQSYQGKGYGLALLNNTVQIALSQNCTHLILNVNKYNPTIYYYLKNGFQIIGEEVIDIGNGYVMDDFVMQKQIVL